MDIQTTHKQLKRADYLFAEQPRTMFNLHRLIHAQRHYYLAQAQAHKHDPLTRSKLMLRRAEQNRIIANTIYRDNILPITLLRQWRALSTNQWHRARRIVMDITIDQELTQTHQPTPPPPKPKRTHQRVIHPITRMYVTLTVEQVKYWRKTGTWPKQEG